MDRRTFDEMLYPVQATMEGLDSSGNIFGECEYSSRQFPAIYSDRAFAVEGSVVGRRDHRRERNCHLDAV